MKTWIKLHTEILRDPKMHSLSDVLFRACINLFALAGQLDENGRLGTVDEIAFHLRLDVSRMTSELEELQQVGVTCNKNGVWRLKNWTKRNGKPASDTRGAVRERVQKHRENKQIDEPKKRARNADVTPLHDERNATREEKNREENKVLGADAPETQSSEISAVIELAQHFEQVAGIAYPDAKTRKQQTERAVQWLIPLREMVKLADGTAADILGQAVRKLRTDDNTVASPLSALKTFRSVYGKHKTQPGTKFKDYN